ncbi:MAG: transposase [Theionarchaea archaeon]|nr:transposase [Theionarchaea archaeon]
MIATDEFGPLQIRPQLGSNWCKKGKPNRFPATYTKKEGVRHLLAALDLRSDKMYGHTKKRKRAIEFLQFLKYIGSLYPIKERLYIILDNFSPHKTEKVLTWAEENNVELVPTPTNASWLNPIECHFGPLKKFAILNSNYKSHKEQARAIRRYIAWRNREAKKDELR